jgi:hypothetical protein
MTDDEEKNKPPDPPVNQVQKQKDWKWMGVHNIEIVGDRNNNGYRRWVREMRLDNLFRHLEDYPSD